MTFVMSTFSPVDNPCKKIVAVFQFCAIYLKGDHTGQVARISVAGESFMTTMCVQVFGIALPCNVY